jgi:two-component system sensor histidine kinase PilS (NtrC family)
MAEKTAILTAPTQAPADMQNVTLFRIYVFYRSLLSILLVLSLLSSETRQMLGIFNRDLYLAVSVIYLVTNLALLATIRSPIINNQAFLFGIFFIDILAITLLSDASGGMESGLPILLIVTAAASAIMVGTGTIATLIAAMSVIAILADTVRLINEQVIDFNALFPAGILGSLIFAVSLLIQVVARRIKRAEALARKRATDLYNLQRLNEQIVQHMETGILLVYDNGTVRVMNQSATQLLDPERPVPLEQGRELAEYNRELARQFEHWQQTGQHTPAPITVREDTPQVIAHFRNLRDSGDTLVFVEDYSPVTQHAQSLKLTSLGRLTASIAHEIRNPLGAVSHAAQLLKESSELQEQDQRMADIIQQHSQRMNAIIENVMQISRRQPPNPQRLELNQWLHTYLQDYSATLRARTQIELRGSEDPLWIEFDPEHLRRILGNLLDNALRHSEMKTGESRAELRISRDHLSQRTAIDVIDFGDGVAPADRAKLFEPFYTTVERGTGLGLFMCKELCDFNSASLTYRFSDDGLSCFRITVAPHH